MYTDYLHSVARKVKEGEIKAVTAGIKRKILITIHLRQSIYPYLYTVQQQQVRLDRRNDTKDDEVETLTRNSDRQL